MVGEELRNTPKIHPRKKKRPGNKKQVWLHMVQQTAMPARHKHRFVFPGARRLKYLHWFTLKYLH